MVKSSLICINVSFKLCAFIRLIRMPFCKQCLVLFGNENKIMLCIVRIVFSYENILNLT